jgi:hypothetical protein
MKSPLFVHELSPQKAEGLEAGLRSQDAFTLRRCQILVASGEGQTLNSFKLFLEEKARIQKNCS